MDIYSIKNKKKLGKKISQDSNKNMNAKCLNY